MADTQAPPVDLATEDRGDPEGHRHESLVTGAGRQFEYRRFPEMGHFMHAQDPALFARTLIDWTSSLASSAER